MRRAILAALIFLAIGPIAGTRQLRPPERFDQRATATPLAAVAADVGAQHGALRFVRGWHLTSPHSRFGGFSGLARLGPGRFQLVGDNGQWVRLTIGTRGRVSALRIAPLPRPSGRPTLKSMVDSEEMFIDPVSGDSWIALENINEFWRIDPRMEKLLARHRTSAMDDWPRRRGPEGMAHLADGRTAVFAEGGSDDPRQNHALIFAGLPGTPATRFFYVSQGLGAVSAAAPLPDGRILLVHRRVGWNPVFTTNLAIVDPVDIREGAVVRGVGIGRIPEPLAENYEGAAVAVVNGRTRLWLVSDNNFQRWQRSLLVEFELGSLPDSKKAAR